MHRIRKAFSLLIIGLVFAVLPVIGEEQEQAKPAEQTAGVADSRTLSDLLPDRLAGIKSRGEIKKFGRDDLAALVADKAAAYQEYRVISALSREYGPARVDVFVSEDRFAAFGLFTYVSGAEGAKSAPRDIGGGGAALGDGTVFYKGNYFVRVSDASRRKGAARTHLHERMAGELAAAIKPDEQADARPPLLDSLPREFMLGESEQYFLGPASIGAYVEGGGDMIGFAGDAEAAMARYQKVSADSKEAAARPALKLIVVEYHTPPFATEALDRLNDYINSLPEQQRDRIIVRREGNYIVQATSFEDREFAEQLVAGIKYPYTVKWLRDPLLPTNDPFRQRKAAEMLLSTFGILGLILMTVLVVGISFGTVIFIKRRKQQQEIFSDAGGMLRLELDPFESNILGLPPRRADD
jgi:hypothetical protein